LKNIFVTERCFSLLEDAILIWRYLRDPLLRKFAAGFHAQPVSVNDRL